MTGKRKDHVKSLTSFQPASLRIKNIKELYFELTGLLVN
jgi:hypothetical protein